MVSVATGSTAIALSCAARNQGAESLAFTKAQAASEGLRDAIRDAEAEAETTPALRPAVNTAWDAYDDGRKLFDAEEWSAARKTFSSALADLIDGCRSVGGHCDVAVELVEAGP